MIMAMSSRFMAGALILATMSTAATAAAQRRNYGYDLSRQLGGDGYYAPPDWRGNPLYDGRVTFVRIRYRGMEHFTDQGPGWAHDYPISETHFAKIMKEITSTRPFVESGSIFGSAIINMDDPQLFKYPVAYLSEPGGWHMSATELAAFKKYIERGGFMVFDDMGSRGNGDMMNLNYEWQRAFPKAKLMLIPNDHPVFDSFFKIDVTKIEAFYGRGYPAQIYGYFEDNDPKKRLIAVINDQQDLGEYIEFSDRGFNVVPSNEAYKLLINYFVYALSH
jgi:hypothetical protein